MPMIGLHVIAGVVNEIDGPVSLHTSWTWSETLASGATSALAVPAPFTGSGGAPAILAQAGSDGWVAVGPSPNASASPRRWIREGENIVIAVNAGDRVAFIAG